MFHCSNMFSYTKTCDKGSCKVGCHDTISKPLHVAFVAQEHTSCRAARLPQYRYWMHF